MIKENNSLSIPQAADLLNVSVTVIRGAVTRKELIAKRYGLKVLRISLEDLENWINLTKDRPFNPKIKNRLNQDCI